MKNISHIKILRNSLKLYIYGTFMCSNFILQEKSLFFAKEHTSLVKFYQKCKLSMS